MRLNDSMVLVLEGKAEKEVFNKLSREYSLAENQRWFFADYSSTKVPLNMQFDVLLEGEIKSLVPGIFVIKIIECLDQFGNNLSEIPEGFKTICKLEFYPEIPHKIDLLPSLDSWKYNPNRITLTSHKNINLDYSDNYINDLSRLAFFILVRDRGESGSVIITKSEFYSYLENNFQMDHKRADNILTVFIQTGKIKPMNNNKIELVAAV